MGMCGVCGSMRECVGCVGSVWDVWGVCGVGVCAGVCGSVQECVGVWGSVWECVWSVGDIRGTNEACIRRSYCSCNPQVGPGDKYIHLHNNVDLFILVHMQTPVCAKKEKLPR